jgi:ribulose 1,5-bisphosphate synthetase/thiazole synthase
MCVLPKLPQPQRYFQTYSSLTQCYSEVDVLVIGAGPTGLGAAKRLNQIVRLPSLHRQVQEIEVDSC